MTREAPEIWPSRKTKGRNKAVGRETWPGSFLLGPLS